MKKIIVFLTVLLLFSFSIVTVVSGEGESFEVVIKANSTDAVAIVGSQCTFTVSYENITADGGLCASDVDLSFDSTVLEFVSAEACTLDGWEISAFLSSSGSVYFRATDESLTDHPVTENGKLYFTATFKVLQTTASTSQLTITKATATAGEDFATVNGSKGSLTVIIPQKLSTPTGLTWDGSVAKWDAVENASGYSVQAYKEGKAVGDAQIASGTSCDFQRVLTEGGKYTFTVIAVSDQPEYEDSAESAQSSGFYTVVGTLATPKIKLTQDFLNGGLEFLITDTNAAGTVQQYVVEIYEKDSNDVVETLQTGEKTGNFLCDGTKIIAGKSYVATVTALTVDDTVNNNSKKSAKTEAVEALEKVTSIKFKTAPTLTYKEGDKLNLSGMVITLTYQSGATKDVAFKDFLDNGLTVSMEDGKELTLGDNGQAITVFYGVSISVTSSNLTVESGTCAHANTTIDRKEPTCGVEGHEKITCNDCGITVSDTVLNATENHSYGEWTIISEPKVNIKGYQERYCSACNYRDVAEIPALLPGQTTTDDGDDDPDDQTDPDDFDPEGSEGDGEGDDGGEDTGSNMNDLSRVFLIIVIVIFSLILLFIVGGTWMESRRKKARAAKRNNRRPPNKR